MLADAVAIIGTMVCLNFILMVYSTYQISFLKDLVFGYVLLYVRKIGLLMLQFLFSLF